VWIKLTSENAASFSNREGGPDAGLDLMPHTFVGRTPASAAGPLAGDSDFVETSTSRARAPGAGQGTRPTNSMRKWEKYVASTKYVSLATTTAGRTLVSTAPGSMPTTTSPGFT